jgi:hypothetical protein
VLTVLVAARAAAYTVTSIEDGSNPAYGTLRYGIMSSPDAIISFDASLAGKTITLSGGRLEIARDVTIVGPACGNVFIDGGHAVGVLYVVRTVHLSNLTIRNGFMSGAGAGGIQNGSTLTLTNCSVLANVASGGQAIAGGGIFNQNSLTLDHTLVSGNSAGSGGGVYNAGGADMLLVSSTISGNQATQGAGIENVGSLTIVGSTISGNIGSLTPPNGAGGGVLNDGVLALTNCTVANNQCIVGGGLWNNNVLTLNHCTIAGNSTGSGTGNKAGGVWSGWMVSIQNTIIANNSSSTSPDVFGTFTSQGYNLIQNTAGSSGWISSSTGGDITGLAARLDILQNANGPTLTMPLLPNSPAIDAGSTGGVISDQRGLPRPMCDPAVPTSNGSDCSDIGAYEYFAGTALNVTTLDDGPDAGPPGSLRNAATFTPAGHIITFDPSLNGGTIVLTGGEIPIVQNLIISGPGPDALCVVSSNSRVFNVAAGVAVNITGLCLSGVYSNLCNNAAGGGAIHNSGNLNLGQCRFSNSSSSGPGGAILNETAGSVTAANCSFYTNSSYGGQGGAIATTAGSVNLWQDIFVGNTAIGPDGAASTSASDTGGVGWNATGGGVSAASSVSVMSNCIFEACSAIGGNGGLGYSGYATNTDGGTGGGAYGGGVYANSGTLEVYNCSFGTNFAIGGTGGPGGGSDTPTMATAGGKGGRGGDVEGGAVVDAYSGNGLTFWSSTFAFNYARSGDGGRGGNGAVGGAGGVGGDAGNSQGGGLMTEAGCVQGECVGYLSCTISGNAVISGAGGNGGTNVATGIVAAAGATSGLIQGGGWAGAAHPIGNTIIASNLAIVGGVAISSAPDVAVNVTGKTEGYNLIGNSVGSAGWLPTDMTGITGKEIDPRLGPLQDNGGPTPTMALLPDSPAINAGNTFGLTAADQRGFPRPQIEDPLFYSIPAGGDGSDIGAFELQPTNAIWISSSNGKWESPVSSWNGYPGAGVNVYITNAGSKTVTMDVQTVSGAPNTLTIANLLVASPGADVNKLVIDIPLGNTFTVSHELFGIGSGNIIEQQNGTVNCPDPHTLRVDCQYLLEGGSLLAGSAVIGQSVPGTLLATGGKAQFGSLQIGVGGTAATLNVSGATVLATSSLGLGTNATVNVTSGSLLASNATKSATLSPQGALSVGGSGSIYADNFMLTNPSVVPIRLDGTASMTVNNALIASNSVLNLSGSGIFSLLNGTNNGTIYATGATTVVLGPNVVNNGSLITQPFHCLATVWHVKTLADSLSDTNSLRVIVSSLARDGDIIEFDVTGTIPLIYGQIRILHSLTIAGPGASLVTVSGEGTDRIFDIGGNDQTDPLHAFTSVEVNVNISGLTLANGLAPADPDWRRGGAMVVRGGCEATLSDCVLSGNSAQAFEGPEASGGAIWNQGHLTALRCTFNDNWVVAKPDGNAWPYAHFGWGGAIYNGNAGLIGLGEAQFAVSDSTFYNNAAYAVANSSATDCDVRGGAIANQGENLYLTNCTLYANSAQGALLSDVILGGAAGGAVYHDPAVFREGSLTLTYGEAYLISCTISGNFATYEAGGIADDEAGTTDVGDTAATTLYLGNTIVAGNQIAPPGPPHDFADFNPLDRAMSLDIGPEAIGEAQISNDGRVHDIHLSGFHIGSLGYNLVGIGGLGQQYVRGLWTDFPGDAPGWLSFPLDMAGFLLGPRPPQDPLLGPLQNNGGSTLTLMPDSLSPVVDSGFNLGQTPEDQRGWSRTYNSGGPLGYVGDTTDRGAVEVQNAFALPTVPSVFPPQSVLMLGCGAVLSTQPPGAGICQWRFNGLDIAGATNSTLVLSNLQSWQAGNYSVVVSNTNGSAASPPAGLKLLGSLMVTPNSQGAGTVLQSPNRSSYLLGSTVRLTAVPSNNWVFQSWSGDVVSSDNPLTLTVGANLAVTANYAYNGSAPAIAPIAPQTVVEGTTLSFPVNATNPVSGPLVYTLDPSAPTNATIGLTTGQFSWTPAENQGPANYQIIVRVAPSNSPALSVLQSFSVTVLESNSAPSIATISNRTVMQLVPLSFTVSATDADIPPNPLRFSLGSGAPTNATIDSHSGRFSWTPTLDHTPGNYPITVRVSDYNPADTNNPSLSATQSFVVTVTALTPETNIWLSSQDGRWDLPGTNWSTGIPHRGDSVLIPASNSNTVSADAFTAQYFNSALTINDLTVAGGALQLNNLGATNPLHVLNSLTLQPGGAMNLSNSTMLADRATLNGVYSQSGGTATVAASFMVGNCALGAGASATLSGGALFVTNATHTATLIISDGTFTLNAGTVIADLIIVTNSCGHFIHNGGALTYGRLILDPNLDADGDGIPNGVEQNYGLDPLTQNPVFTVINNNDSGAGSLRAAIANANAAVNAVVTFANNVTGTITLTSGELAVAPPTSPSYNNLTILGPGAKVLAVNGNGASRVFNISGAPVNIHGLTITNGFASGADGGGIFNGYSTLALDSCTVVGNRAQEGAGLYNYGPFSGSAVMRLNRCTISGNSASSIGGGIVNDGFNGGSATLTLTNCTFLANTGVVAAVYNAGDSGSSTLRIFNSTFAGNTGLSGFPDSVLSTAYSGSALVELGSSLFKAGANANFENDGASTFTSRGYNLSSDAAGGNSTQGPGGLLNATGDQRNTDPKLDPAGLRDNGGSTPTLALLPNSPAIDQGISGAMLLDQQQNSGPNTTGNVDVWQSFTAGISGRLVQVGLGHWTMPGGSNTSGTVSIYTGEGTSGTLLATTSVTFSNVIGLQLFPIPSGPQVAAGNQYTFRCMIPGAPSVAWVLVDTTNPYAGGRAVSGATFDYVFQTYVVPPTTDQRGVTRPYDIPHISNATGGDGSDIGAFELVPPALSVARSGASVIVSWPSPSPGFFLYQNTSLANPHGWSLYPGTVSDNGVTRSVTISSPASTLFFRLGP